MQRYGTCSVCTLRGIEAMQKEGGWKVKRLGMVNVFILVMPPTTVQPTAALAEVGPSQVPGVTKTTDSGPQQAPYTIMVRR